MKRFFPLLFLVSLVACEKDPHHEIPPPPAMRYTNLADLALGFGQQKQLDLDGDNTVDVLFSTVLIGDPVLEIDRRQYFASGMFHVSFLMTDDDEMPVFKAGDAITAQGLPGYHWYNANLGVLAEKIIPVVGNPMWQGDWKNARHRFIAVRVTKGDQHYYGWVEISFDITTEKVTLHRTAVATQANRPVVAG